MRTKFNPKNIYTPHKDEEKIKISARKIIEYVLKDSEIHPHVRKIVIGYMLWALTEIKQSLKYNTRYYSEKALKMDEPPRHEHVYTKKYITNLILGDYPQYLNLLPQIVGCTVAKSEALQLNKIDKQYPDLQGWERYKKANIRVFDRLKQQFLW